ncbi:MAG TPA: O-antigen ligase family protein [Pyrinomonadaceae bacterium]|nr:O-antigen ligase family protein [Pyrinomonadaceae bacterium]
MPMRKKFDLQDYESLTPSLTRGHSRSFEPKNDSTVNRIFPVQSAREAKNQDPRVTGAPKSEAAESQTENAQAGGSPQLTLKHGHSLTYFGLFIFTLLVYFRPYELLPSLHWLSRSALVMAVLTLAVYVPTQLGLENRITARLREVKLALALLLCGLLSVPLALEPNRALQSWVEFSKVVVIFVVMVNVVRTEKRLRALLGLVLIASCILSLAGLIDYLQGNLALQGRRIAGLIGGLFSNPNDLALHLVTMFPISLALFLGSRGPLKKSLYLCSVLLLVAGLVATFSRGGFLGFVFVVAFVVWKLARRNRVVFGGFALTLVLAAVALAPSAYRGRLATTDDDSAVARTDDLKRSILVAVAHPVVGVGMDNYILYSNMNKATHNAYTQVASETGLVALLVYVWFLVSPLKPLRRIEEANRSQKRRPAAYYLAVGLQASLVGYMVVSFFASVAYLWYAYYLVAYAICLRRIYAHAVEIPTHAPVKVSLPASPARVRRLAVEEN